MYFLLFYIWDNNNSEVDCVFKTQAKVKPQEQKCSDMQQVRAVCFAQAGQSQSSVIACHFTCVCCVINLMEDRRITLGTQSFYDPDPTISLYNMLKKYFNPNVIGSYYLLQMIQTHTQQRGCTKHGKKSLSFFF